VPELAALRESGAGTKRRLPRIYDAGPLLGVERQRSCDCREGGGSSARDPELKSLNHLGVSAGSHGFS